MRTPIFVGFILLLTSSVSAAEGKNHVREPNKFSNSAPQAPVFARREAIRCRRAACNRVSAAQLNRLRAIAAKSKDRLIRVTPESKPRKGKKD